LSKVLFYSRWLNSSLQVLHLHNNHLTSLPDELAALRRLFSLVIAFNRLLSLPPVVAQMTNVRVSEVESVVIPGNQIERLSSESLVELKYAKRIDLRLNSLTLPMTETMKFTVLERLTHLDVSDNRITDLDLRSLRVLEFLNCERNSMTGIQLNGVALRTLFAANNRK
jgi:PH domain/leucine-rich repeat-containing protein phosphatase